MTVFFNGPWSYFWWALGATLVAKWLAKGFEDNKNRIAFESELVADGLSPNEAGEIWLKKYTGIASPTQDNDDPTTIIQDYGDIIVNSAPTPGCVADESKLPYPKEKIKEAIIWGLRNTEDPDAINSLKFGYVQLASWQPGIGESDKGLDLTKLDLNQDIMIHAEEIIKQTGGSNDWKEASESERETLYQELEHLGFGL